MQQHQQPVKTPEKQREVTAVSVEPYLKNRKLFQYSDIPGTAEKLPKQQRAQQTEKKPTPAQSARKPERKPFQLPDIPKSQNLQKKQPVKQKVIPVIYTATTVEKCSKKEKSSRNFPTTGNRLEPKRQPAPPAAKILTPASAATKPKQNRSRRPDTNGAPGGNFPMQQSSNHRNSREPAACVIFHRPETMEANSNL